MNEGILNVTIEETYLDKREGVFYQRSRFVLLGHRSDQQIDTLKFISCIYTRKLATSLKLSDVLKF